ncbi:cytochrome b/b6 domain-containing protein [Candidatus Magnetaquicoccus inordinatus]|uniref:cytochrome b/b6 domain-containing protein n=1 Tax=Candidatus Magnetaquicoccus inordinatus TaxID=2496818 RepID=UPI00102BB350|nr:cytochrome b/b6 domain-containing protein [Candidatus Magnetaquicoccus inordinatus]
MYYDRFTRVLHLTIAVGGVVQLLSSLLMTHPKPGRAGDALYAMHDAGGQVLLALLMIHWLWSLLRQGEVKLLQLWPWFTPSQIPGIVADARQMLSHFWQRKIPEGGRFSPLAAAVQGVGLMLATLLGGSGLLLSNAAAEGVAMVGWLHDVKEGHELLGTLMWFYLIVHASMAMLHHWAGHDTVRAMLRIWEKEQVATANHEHVAGKE